ncbi:uncharacterized protein LOC142048407 [Phalacrocorax aristotelis]|uniref:uncharacterized protein LOC142048407 n=1 Tax=Phalacrocorax aristotelis TaxID=126867 RepID=UPI003F4B9703
MPVPGTPGSPRSWCCWRCDSWSCSSWQGAKPHGPATPSTPLHLEPRADLSPGEQIQQRGLTNPPGSCQGDGCSQPGSPGAIRHGCLPGTSSRPPRPSQSAAQARRAAGLAAFFLRGIGNVASIFAENAADYCKGKRHPRVCLISIYLRRHGGKINALGSKQLSAAELGAQRCRQRGADECLLGLTRAPRPAPAQGGKVTVRQGQDTRLERLSWDHQNSTGRGEKTQPTGEMGNGFPAGPADRRCRTPRLPTPRGLACATRRLSGLHRHGPGWTGAPEPMGPGPGGLKQAGVPCYPSSPPSLGPSLPPSSPPPSSPLIPTSPRAAEGDSPASPCQTTKRTRALASPHPKSCPGREGHRRLAAARRDAGEMHWRPELRLGSAALIDCD